MFGNAEANPNLVYPVTGATGMGEVVRTYIKLEMLTDVIVRDRRINDLPDQTTSHCLIKGNAVIAFSDVLKFTTNVSAGVKSAHYA